MRRSSLRPVSRKRAAVMRMRQKIRERLREERGPWCQVRGPHCTGREQGLHELVGRAQGGSLTDERNLVLCCNVDNGWIEDFPPEARDAGWKCPQWHATEGEGGLVPSGSWLEARGWA